MSRSTKRTPEQLIARLRLLAAELEGQRRPVPSEVATEAADMVEALTQERCGEDDTTRGGEGRPVLHPNPFAGPIPFGEKRRLASTQVEATLALAYEQRTSSLIATLGIVDEETAQRLWVDHIAPRLGLGVGQS